MAVVNCSVWPVFASAGVGDAMQSNTRSLYLSFLSAFDVFKTSDEKGGEDGSGLGGDVLGLCVVIKAVKIYSMVTKE